MLTDAGADRNESEINTSADGAVFDARDAIAPVDSATDPDTSESVDAVVDAGEQDGGSPADAGAQDDGSPADATPRDVVPSVDAARPDGGVACTACSAYSNPTTTGTASATAITEASGIAASWRNPGVLYVHNDSGDGPRFFALTETGAALGEFTLTGAPATDWEDMAVGPCPAGSCVYLGDVGDNAAARTNYRIFRVAEPDVRIGMPVGARTVMYDTLPFSYPDRSHNCETLLVHPITGDIYVVTKEGSGTSGVYRMPRPLTPGVSARLIHVGDMVLPATGNRLATGGDIHPCGDRLLLRTYDRLYEYRAPGAMFESAFTATPTTVPVSVEAQGEAVAWFRDARGYVTLSEGTMPALHVARCR